MKNLKSELKTENLCMANNNATVVKSQRINEIDYLKTFAILLVVWGHFLECFSSPYSNLIYQLIYMFHMPLFIFISGYLSKFKYKNIFKFCLCYMCFYCIYIIFNHYITGSDLKFNLFYPYWLLWYLVSLVCWIITIPLLDRINSKFYTLVLSILFLIGLSIGFCLSINRFVSLSRTLVFYPFFVMGYFKKKSKKFNFEIKINTLIKIVLIIFALLMFAFLIRMNLFSNNSFYMADPYNGINHNILQRFLIYIFSTIMIILLCSFIITKTNKLIKSISMNTLTIFLLHGFIINIFKHFAILDNSVISIFFSFIMSVITVFILTLVGIFINLLKNIILNRKTVKK